VNLLVTYEKCYSMDKIPPVLWKIFTNLTSVDINRAKVPRVLHSTYIS